MANIAVPSQFKAVTIIGDPIAVFRPDRRKTLILVLSIIAAGIAAIGLAVWLLQPNPQYSPVIMVGLGIVILAAVLAIVRRAAAHWNDACLVCHGGFVYSSGESILLFEWNDIVDIAVNIASLSRGKDIVATVRDLTITHRNGKRLLVSKALSGYGELCDLIREKAVPYILANSRQVFLIGKLVWFGEVAMGKDQGIIVGHDNLRWRDIGQISLERRRVVVKPKQGRELKALSAPVVDVHNLDVFLALGEEMMEEFG